jgi:tetratricopeptide (TPR) repeat protein
LGFSSKKEAINELLKVLNKKNIRINDATRENIKKYISAEIRSDMHLFKKIFKDITVKNTKDFCFATENQFKFLTYIKNNKFEINLSANVEDGKLITKFSETSGYGLIDALALFKNKNLHIYHSAGNNQIILTHLFELDSAKPFIYLIDKDTHFNKLVSTTNIEKLKKAQEIEDKLNLIAQKKTSSSVIEIDNNTQSSDHIINNNNYRSNVTAIRSRSNNIINEIQRIDLTENEILKFLNDDSPRAKIRNFDFKTSCQKIYDHYTFIDINATNNDSKLEDDCALAILFLSKNFAPSSITKKEFCEDLLSKLDFIINTIGSDAKIKKYRHYAHIYKARIYMALQEYQKAWVELIDLYFQKTSYTKCYHLDMAELIIDRQFTPKNTTRNQALQFAKSLLRTTGSRPNNTKKTHVRSVTISNIFHPNYRNDIESKQKEYQLSKKIEAEENIISDDSSSDLSSDESDAENPFIEISIDAMNIENPIVSNTLKRKRPISSERLSKHQKINESDKIQNNNNIVYENDDINIEEDENVDYVVLTFSDQYLDHLKNKSKQFILRGNYYTKRNPNKALKFYTEGIQKYPSSGLYCALGNLYCYNLKNYEQAEKIYKTGIKFYPSSDLYRALGNLYCYDLKNYEQAKETYEEGIKFYPSSDLYHSLGNLYCHELKNYEQAKETYEEGIKLYPSLDFYHSLGKLYHYEQKDYKLAEKIYKESIQKCPSSDLYRACGDLYYYALKDFEQAEKPIKKAFKSIHL